MALTLVNSGVIENGTIRNEDISSSTIIDRAKLDFANPPGAQTFYLAPRTDGRGGSGAQNDPYDASTSIKLKAVVASLPANSTIRLLRGTYLVDGGLFIPQRCNVIGDGMSNTIIRLTSLPATGRIVVIESGTENVLTDDHILFSDFTADCNWQNLRVANRSQIPLFTRTRHGTIERVKVINCGGDITNGVEAFAMGATYVRNCIFTNPARGFDGGLPYVTIFNGGGLRYPNVFFPDEMGECVIENCYADGLTSDGAVSCFAGMAGSHYNTLRLCNNKFVNCFYGLNGDSNFNINFICDGNSFINCARCINITFSTSDLNPIPLPANWNGTVIKNYNIEPVPPNAVTDFTSYLRHATITNNLCMAYVDNLNTAGGGRVIRAIGLDTIVIRGNIGFRTDQSETVNFQGGIILSEINHATIENNVIYKNLASSVVNGCRSVQESNNVDEDGIRQYIVPQWFQSVTVKASNIDPEKNAIALRRAIIWASSATPNNQTKSVLNRATIYIEEGKYSFEADESLSSNSVTGTGSNIAFVGLGDPRNTVLESAKAEYIISGVNASSGLNNVFKNITLRKKSGTTLGFLISPQQLNNNAICDNVIFEVESGPNAKAISDGAHSYQFTLYNCESKVALLADNGQGFWNVKAYNCRFSGGIGAAVTAGSEFVNCVFSQNSNVRIGPISLETSKLTNCRFINDQTTNSQLNINSVEINNCYFKNINFYINTGHTAKIFNSTIEIDSSVNSIFGPGTVTVGAVASNGIIAGTITKTTIPLL
jgi:hypothetical protein